MCTFALLSAVLSDVFQALLTSRLLPIIPLLEARVCDGGGGEELKNLIGLAPSLTGPSQSLLCDLGSALGQIRRDRLRLRVLHSTAGMILNYQRYVLDILSFQLGR